MIKDGVIYPSLEENILLLNDFREDVLDGLLTMYLYGGGNIKGIVSTVDALPATGENLGDGYLVGTDPYDLYIWATKDGNAASWVPLGKFPAKGEQGTRGDRGSIIINQASDPKNAPDRSGDYWINTVTGDWFMSLKNTTASGGYYWSKRFNLKGKKGDRGPQGYQGVPGPVGPQGPVGPAGATYTPMDLDLNTGISAVTYNTTNGISLTTQGTIRANTGTNQVVVDYEIPIVAGNNILIDKKADENKIEVKLDQSKDIKIIGGSNNSVYFTSDSSASFSATEGTIYSSFGDESGIPRIRQKDPGGQRTYTFPTNTYGEHTVLTSKNVKTLLGKSIVGTGNIGLYRHVIKITGGEPPYNDCFAYLTIISSINLNVKSLRDLKTLIGNTFEYPATGYDKYNLGYVYKVTQDGIISTNNQGGNVSLSFANMTVFTDTVTTV